MEFKDLNATVKVVGELVVDEQNISELKILPTEQLLAIEDTIDTIVICVGCYDPANNQVYVGGGVQRSHKDLKRVHDNLYDTGNQQRLDSLIYGFVLQGGYFVNRIQLSEIIVEHHFQLTQARYRYVDEYFNSEMINWTIAKEKLTIMKRRKERAAEKAQASENVQ